MNLSELTTMRVGGPARILIDATTTEGLIEAAREAWAEDDALLVLGGGSNVVISDEGFGGTVIRVLTRGIEPLDGGSTLKIAAGTPWDAVVKYAVQRDLAGIEALSGIPGSTGAAPIQNIGAYGQELSDTLVSIDFLNAVTGEVVTLPASELELGYRTSAMKRGRQGVVLAVVLKLEPTPPDSAGSVVKYDQLARALNVEVGDRMPLREIRRAVLALRSFKGMVLDPDDPDSVSCGSFFTNPIVSENFARSLPPEAPRWPLETPPPPAVAPLGEVALPPPRESDAVKLSAAWLIEQSGVGKGFRLPGSHAAISSKHSLAIVNRTGATAEEVAQLARYIQMVVLSRFGVELQPEPVLVGIEL